MTEDSASNCNNRSTRVLTADNRGLIWTLSAALVVIILVGSLGTIVVFTSTGNVQQASSDTYTQQQLGRDAYDTLRVSNASGALANTALYYNYEDGGEDWFGADDLPENSYYTQLSADHPMGPVVNQTLVADSLRYNLDISWQTQGGGSNSRRVVYQGPPAEGASTQTFSVVVSDNDQMVNSDGSLDSCTVLEVNQSASGCSGSVYLPHAYPDSGLYNIVEYQITVWTV